MCCWDLQPLKSSLSVESYQMPTHLSGWSWWFFFARRPVHLVLFHHYKGWLNRKMYFQNKSLLNRERKARCYKGLQPPAQLYHQTVPILINSGVMLMLAFSLKHHCGEVQPHRAISVAVDSHVASPLALLSLQSFLSHHQFYGYVLSPAVPEVATISCAKACSPHL